MDSGYLLPVGSLHRQQDTRGYALFLLTDSIHGRELACLLVARYTVQSNETGRKNISVVQGISIENVLEEAIRMGETGQCVMDGEKSEAQVRLTKRGGKMVGLLSLSTHNLLVSLHHSLFITTFHHTSHRSSMEAGSGSRWNRTTWWRFQRHTVNMDDMVSRR